VNGDVIYYTW